MASAAQDTPSSECCSRTCSSQKAVADMRRERRVIRRLVAPPAAPVLVPLTASRPEHVGPHHVGTARAWSSEWRSHRRHWRARRQGASHELPSPACQAACPGRPRAPGADDPCHARPLALARRHVQPGLAHRRDPPLSDLAEPLPDLPRQERWPPCPLTQVSQAGATPTGPPR